MAARWKTAAPVLLGVLASGCGGSSVAADAVASAEHCGGEMVTPTLVTRLSRYSVGVPSTTMHVVQLCHPERGCTAVAEYQNGRPPIVRLTRERLRLIVPMVSGVTTFHDTAWVNGHQIPLEVVPWPIRTDDEVRQANTALGLSPGARSYMPACFSDLTPRPYITARPRTPAAASITRHPCGAWRKAVPIWCRSASDGNGRLVNFS